MRTRRRRRHSGGWRRNKDKWRERKIIPDLNFVSFFLCEYSETQIIYWNPSPHNIIQSTTIQRLTTTLPIFYFVFAGISLVQIQTSFFAGGEKGEAEAEGKT
jgi:hypothetical protein